MKLLILLSAFLLLISCTEPKTTDRDFDINDPDVPVLKITNVCLDGISYHPSISRILVVI